MSDLSVEREEAKETWIRAVLQPFRAEARRRLFLGISVFCHHNQPIQGYYFEFGCHGGRTMRLAYDAFHALYDWTYVAFDSFEGLPEIEDMDRMPIWKKGDLCTSEDEFIGLMTWHGIPRDKLITVKGLYHESLTPALRERLSPVKAAVIYVDCDLYASTVPVLAFVKDFLQRGTVIVFDDWFCFHGDPLKGERRAFNEFRVQHPDMIFEEFIQTSEAKAFIYLGPQGA